MNLSVYEKEANKLITSKDDDSRHISITLDGKIFWDNIDVSKYLELRIEK